MHTEKGTRRLGGGNKSEKNQEKGRSQKGAIPGPPQVFGIVACWDHLRGFGRLLYVLLGSRKRSKCQNGRYLPKTMVTVPGMEALAPEFWFIIVFDSQEQPRDALAVESQPPLGGGHHR